MAPRATDPPATSDVRTALGYLVRVAHAHAAHVEDLRLLNTLRLLLTRRQRLTRDQSARTREAQKELVRYWQSAGPLVNDGYRQIDPLTAVDYVLKRRMDIHDRHALAALRSIAEAGAKYEEAYTARALERESLEVYEAVKAIYVLVRNGLPIGEQRAQLAAAFEAVDLRLLPKGLRALVRSADQIRDAGGPSDCAKQTVGLVFGNSEGTMGQRSKRGTPLPRGITWFAFAKTSNLVAVTGYVLRTLGWTEAEATQLEKFARELYEKNPRSDKAFFFSPPT